MQKLTLQIIYSFIIRWFLKFIVGVKMDNASFMLREKQFVIVANHNSHLDTMSLLASVPRRIIHKVKPIAAADHFGKTEIKGKLVSFFTNALLIERKFDRKNSEKDPINMMIKAIDEGFSLIIFPEGTRGEPEKEQSLKKGVGLVLSQRPHIKFIPAYMKGMGNAMPKGDNLIIPFNSSLKYGLPNKIQTPNVDEIMLQIESSLHELKSL